MDGHQNRQQTKPKCSRAGVAGLVVLQKCVWGLDMYALMSRNTRNNKNDGKSTEILPKVSTKEKVITTQNCFFS